MKIVERVDSAGVGRIGFGSVQLYQFHLLLPRYHLTAGSLGVASLVLAVGGQPSPDSILVCVGCFSLRVELSWCKCGGDFPSLQTGPPIAGFVMRLVHLNLYVDLALSPHFTFEQSFCPAFDDFT